MLSFAAAAPPLKIDHIFPETVSFARQRLHSPLQTLNFGKQIVDPVLIFELNRTQFIDPAAAYKKHNHQKNHHHCTAYTQPQCQIHPGKKVQL